MEGALRIQDIIGLILAILIVAILISIILILRENARERRRWQEEDYGDWRDRKAKRNLSFSSGEEEGVSTVFEDRIPEELEKKKGWESLPRQREVEETREEKKKERVVPPPPEEVFTPPEEPVIAGEPTRKGEPRQVILERALRKIEDLGVDINSLKPQITEEVIHFSPLLWEVREEVKAGKELGDIVIHTVFKDIPGYSRDEVVELYRSGDLSVVERLESRIKTGVGRDYLVATLDLEHFRILELEQLWRRGNLEDEEYELLLSLKFVDRNTKRDFARVVYARIVAED